MDSFMDFREYFIPLGLFPENLISGFPKKGGR
jgi:hypothetical protein